jgi:hypothetical protein
MCLLCIQCAALCCAVLYRAVSCCVVCCSGIDEGKGMVACVVSDADMCKSNEVDVDVAAHRMSSCVGVRRGAFAWAGPVDQPWACGRRIRTRA